MIKKKKDITSEQKRDGLVVILGFVFVIAGLFFGLYKYCQGNSIPEGLKEVESTNKLTKIENIELTNDNQLIKVGNRNYYVKIGTDNQYGYLYVADEDNNILIDFDAERNVQNGYLTDKFMFFTTVAQDGEMIAYVVNENGEVVVNNNEYQMNSFKILDGNLHASGHIFCGLDGYCPDQDLLIKYENNTLIVTKAE